jgi:putative sugar O-methyltransferase
MGGVLTLLTGQNALEALAAQAEKAEKSRSIYWDAELANFFVSADGRVNGSAALGNASENVSTFNKFAHSILQWPLRRLASKFSSRDDCLRLGSRIAERQNRLLTYDMVRQTFSLAMIRYYLDMRSPELCNLVIGDGYGVLTTLFAMHAPHRKTIAVNLTKPLLLDLAYFNQALPAAGIALVSDGDEMMSALIDDNIRVIGVRSDDASCISEAPIGVAANVVSMQEMDPTVVSDYFHLLRHNKAEQTAFYCCNKLYKKLSDGTELKFNDYPWEPNDKILHDSICPWSQWYYDKNPPFWHYRRGTERIIWHRLAYLENFFYEHQAL